MEAYKHQIEAIEFGKTRTCSYIAHEMGLGKTFTALMIVKEMKNILIVCPKILIANWKNEIEKFVPGLDAKIINYERLKEIEEKPKAIIFDEAHYLKNHMSKRTKEAERLTTGMPPYKIIMLSGTPIKNKVADLYSQLRIMGNITTVSWMYFMKRYCGAYKGKWGWVTDGATHIEELHERIKDTMHIRKKEDCLDLPEKNIIITTTEAVKELLEEEKKITGEIKDIEKTIEELEKKKENFNAIMKIRAMIEKRKIALVTEMAKNILEEKEKLIIMTWHKEPAEILYREIEESTVITGDIGEEERQKRIRMFKEGTTRLLIGTMATCGIGLNLTEADTMIMTMVPFEIATFNQATDRIHRIGQTKKVTIILPIMDGSLEAHIAKRLKEKTQIERRIIK